MTMLRLCLLMLMISSASLQPAAAQWSGASLQPAARQRLQQALNRYQQMAHSGGWPHLDTGPALRKGAAGPRVRQLRRRLRVTGDLQTSPSPSDTTWDAALERAVRSFQRRHGLVEDAIVGPVTRTALNVPVEERVQQIRVNLARWNRLPRLPSRYVHVNVPAFTLEAVENGRQALTMRVIVGTPETPTLLFETTVTQVVLNPYGYVPTSIAVQEILPRLKRDPAYLARNDMRLIHDGRYVEPTQVDWQQISPSNFPYRIRQEPGPANPLGEVEFIIPNPHDIRLHDTSERHLFREATCAFSYGCIRVEKPVELAAFVLHTEEWTLSRLRSAIDSEETTTIRVTDPMPVHIRYWTAWVAPQGTIHFRRDIYGNDRNLRRTL